MELSQVSYLTYLQDTFYQEYFKMTTPKPIEKEKVFAEKLNGRAAMLGFIAAVGAYLTTGQIIPGFV